MSTCHELTKSNVKFIYVYLYVILEANVGWTYARFHMRMAYHKRQGIAFKNLLIKSKEDNMSPPIGLYCVDTVT